MRKVVLLLIVVFTLSLCGDAMASGIKDEDVVTIRKSNQDDIRYIVIFRQKIG